MGLKDLTFAERTIETPGGTFSVRGLSLIDILGLFHRHRGELSDLYDNFKASAGNATGAEFIESAESLSASLLRALPDIAAEVIAAGAGSLDDDSVRIAASLPLPVQLEAIEAVSNLTFTPENPPKKVLAAIVRLAKGTTAAANGLQA